MSGGVYRAAARGVNRMVTQYRLHRGAKLRFEGMTWDGVGKDTRGHWRFRAKVPGGWCEVAVAAWELRYAPASMWERHVQLECQGRKTNYPMLPPDARHKVWQWLDDAAAAALVVHRHATEPYFFLPGRVLPHPDLGAALQGEPYHGRMDR